MSKKTALIILQHWVENDLKLDGYEHQEIIDKIQSLLPAEQEQIQDAFNSGYNECDFADTLGSAYSDATDYYNKNYK